MTSFRAQSASTLEELLDLQQIQQLKYRYMRAIDTHDWDLIETCFALDASVWYSGGAIRRTGRAEIAAFFRDNIGPRAFSSHIALHPEISFTSATTAKGIWRFQDIVFTTREDAPGSPDEYGLRKGQRAEGAGIYHDEYVKVDGNWLIQSTGFVRIYEYWATPGYGWDGAFEQHTDHGLKVSDARGLRDETG